MAVSLYMRAIPAVILISTLPAVAASLSVGAVVNGASYANAVAPGSMVSIFGTFPLTGPVSVSLFPIPTALGGLSFQFGNAPLAPLFYAASGQVNAQIPWELAGQSQTSVTAGAAGQLGAPQSVNLAMFAPGIFTSNGQGTGQGAVVDASYRLVDSSNPASPGTVLQIYCTGLGPVTHQPPTGSRAPSNPLSDTTAEPTVTIGGVMAQVLFSGLAPGFVGLYQVNVEVPPGIAGGSAVPVVLSIGGVPSNTVTVSVSTANPLTVSISMPSQTVNVAQGGSASLGIIISDQEEGGESSVKLQASAPIGVTVTFPNSPVDPNTYAVFSIAAAGSASTGPGVVTIQANSTDGGQGSISFPIYVDPTPGTIPGNRTNWVRLESNPISVYYDAPRNHVLASLPNLNQVAVIDPSDGTVVSKIPVSVANFEPNGVWLASSSNLSATLDGSSLLVLGAGHVAKIDLTSGQVVGQQAIPQSTPIGWTEPAPIYPTFLVAASAGHIIFGSKGDSAYYNWDGVSPLASFHALSDLYSFDRNPDGTKVLIASGDTSGAYELLDVVSDAVVAKRSYSNATVIEVRGNPTSNEWAVANSNGINFLDANLNLLAGVSGSGTYWGMTYSADGKYLYFVESPYGLPFLVTVDDKSHQVIRIAPATGTDIAYIERDPSEWVTQPFAADTSGLVFGLGEKGLVVDDSNYIVDPTQATVADHAIIATPDNGPLSGSTVVEVTSQTYSAQPDVWFGSRRALGGTFNGFGPASAIAPPAQSPGPVNIKLFPPDGYAHLMPQAFTYGTIITSVRNSICAAAGGCTADIFGFGLFGSNGSQTSVTIGGTAAPVQFVHYFNADQPYPYPLQYVRVSVPPGLPGRADVVVNTGVGQGTLPGGFLYASSLRSYPSSQAYNALLFDDKRGILYASTNNEIARFSVSSSSFLTPITPPSVTGKNEYQAMALTPDGSRLIVANEKDASVAVIDPDNPTNAKAIAMPTTAGPVFVAATSTGQVLISTDGTFVPLYELDLATSQIQSLSSLGVFTNGTRLCSTGDGSQVLIRSYGGTSIGIWNAATQLLSPVADGFAGSGLGAAAGDGNLFAVGLGFFDADGRSTVGFSIPDELGGFQSFFPNDATLNDSGSLEFAPSATSLFILDTKHGSVLRSMTLPNSVNVWTKVIAVDSTADHVFLSDSNGLTVLSLALAPLAVGSLTPSAVSKSGGTIVNLRGSGFQPGTVVMLGGQTATAAFVDANTLQVTTPANPAGAAQLTVQNPDGEKYQLDAAILYQ